MLVRELLARLEHGQKSKDIAQKLGIGYKTIQKELKYLGYHWDNSKKRWIYTDTSLHSVEPLEHDIFPDIEDDFDRSLIPPPAPKGEEKVKFVPPVSEMKEKYDSPLNHIRFTREEVADIRSMLEEWKRKEPKQEESQPLHDRIKSIVSQNKIRKTIIVNESISKRLDSFSESERVNKSDVVELALMDFIDRYSK